VRHPTRRLLRACAFALALGIAVAQPLFLAVPPARAAESTIVVEGGRLQVVRTLWNRYGPLVMTFVWELVEGWLAPDPGPGDPPTPPPPTPHPPPPVP